MIVLRTLLLIVGLLSWSAAQAHHSDFLASHVNDGLTIDACDSAGNTRTNSGNVFLYDWANRLTNAVIGTTNIAIVYNGDGHRVKKTVVVGTTTNTTLYLVDDHNPTGYAQVVVSAGSQNQPVMGR